MIEANSLPAWPTFGGSLEEAWEIRSVSLGSGRPDRPVLLHVRPRGGARPVATMPVSWCGALAADSPICHRSWAAIAFACAEADPVAGLPFAASILSDATDASALIAADWLEERARLVCLPRAGLWPEPGRPLAPSGIESAWHAAVRRFFWRLPGWDSPLARGPAGPAASWARALVSRFCIGCPASAGAIGGREGDRLACERCGRISGRGRPMPIPRAIPEIA